MRECAGRKRHSLGMTTASGLVERQRPREQELPEAVSHDPTNQLTNRLESNSPTYCCFTNSSAYPFCVSPIVVGESEAVWPGSFGMSWRLKITAPPEMSTVP